MTYTYRVWLGEMLLAAAATYESAVEAAIREYEQQAGEPPYGEYPLFPSREDLLAALLFEVKAERDADDLGRASAKTRR